jgi:hypothetical protein
VHGAVDGAVLTVDRAALADAVDHAHGGAHFPGPEGPRLRCSRLGSSPSMRRRKTRLQTIKG